MNPIPSSEGEKVNWINYHTRVKDVYFRMIADNKSASISISLEHPDAGIQELYYEQLLQLTDLLHAAVGEVWNWRPRMEDANGRIVSRVSKELDNVSVFNREDWPTLISFFKPRIIALDAFWEDARFSFDW